MAGTDVSQIRDQGGDGDAPVPDLWQQIEATLAELRALTLVERAAQLFSRIAPNISASDQRAQMSSLLAKWLPDFGMNYTPEQWDEWHDLQLLLQEAFEVLVLTRLLVSREGADRFGTVVAYTISADGHAAFDAGDAAGVIPIESILRRAARRQARGCHCGAGGQF